MQTIQHNQYHASQAAGINNSRSRLDSALRRYSIQAPLETSTARTMKIQVMWRSRSVQHSALVVPQIFRKVLYECE